MSILFAGTSLSDFILFGNPAVNTTATSIGPYVNEGVALAAVDEADYIAAPFAAVSEVWLSCWWGGSAWASASADNSTFEMGTPTQSLVRIAGVATMPSTPTWKLQIWSGTAWSTLVTGFSLPLSRNKFDIRVKLHDTDGIIAVYINGGLIASYIGDTLLTAQTTVSYAKFMTSYTNTPNGTISAVLIGDEDTRDMVFDQNQFASNGSNTAWTGTYTDVTKTGRGDAGLIKSGTGGQLETYNQADVDSELTLLDVRSVIIPLRCRRGSSGPTNIQGVTRVGGTDYTSSSLNPDTTWDYRMATFDTNPATGLPWAITEVNAAEFGVKSIT